MIRTLMGAGYGAGPQHSQNLYAMLTSIPGIKVACPSSPADAKGLLTAAIRDDDPVIFCEHKMLYGEIGEVPDGEYIIPFGQANITRKGTQVTIVAFARMVLLANKVADKLAKEGISVEVIDPRTTSPLDRDSILESVRKTGRLVVVDEADPYCGMASEIASLAACEALASLKAPVQKVDAAAHPCAFDTRPRAGVDSVAREDREGRPHRIARPGNGTRGLTGVTPASCRAAVDVPTTTVRRIRGCKK